MMNDVIFVYSELQIRERNEILNKRGQRFVCGKLYTGAGNKPFSRIIKEKDLDAMKSQYPDMKIVGQGNKSNFRYVNVSSELNI